MVSVPNRRLVLAALAVTALLLVAGCTSNQIPDEQLDSEYDYSDLRERNATVAIDLEAGGLLDDGSFAAVYDLEDTDEIDVYRSGLFSDSPLDVESVRFWYANGTVVNGSELAVDRGQSQTTISLPASNGTVAFSGAAGKKSFSLPAFRSGSYNVTLPANQRSSSLILGSVSPGGFERSIHDDTETLQWESVDEPLSLQYYHERDVWIFYGAIALAVVGGGIAAAATYRRLAQLRRQRAEMGIEDDPSE
ncbi:hypothetical protein Halru_1282 [Halovivax ruber XH-70]|uniref:Uncharacterized protein n=1 Tax=Halovivax ruber (strain DSM 18193 / JCM 13892 / XH-70) TaxID=797302 RepID=L0ICF6_HALRX|nr:DUF5803 family protein [Halovivax ruber]AGB15896.1 hypothetical protein Halru_1282 [Halovivax ruber XH-70]